jgi:selenocysteine lyase/cysteine desulfurase
MIGSMAAVRVPGLASDAEALALIKTLYDEASIEVPFAPWPVPGARRLPSDPPRQVHIRVSAQRYNDAGDIDRLIEELTRRGVGRSASAIVNG